MRSRQRLRDFIAVLLGFRRKNDMDSRLRQEIAFHIDMATEQKMHRGMAPDEARRTALVEFGGREQWRESARDEVRSRPLEELLHDARYALRSLRRAPAFTAAAIATLALSIGATTSIFSVVNAVLLRRLPYPNADRIVALCEKNLTKLEQPVCGVGSLNPGNFLAWHDRVSSLEASAAFVEQRVAITANGADPIAAQSRFTTAEIFKVLGARPSLGRFFTVDEDRPGGPNVLVLSHALWQQHFGGDPGIVGRQLRMNENEYTVIGVTAADFGLYDPVDVWIPIRFTAAQRSAPGRFLRAVGLLKPGASLEEADRELKRVALERQRELPAFNTNMTALARPLRQQLVGNSERALWTLLAAVGFLLLIACANVANLLLARAADRGREVAVRISLGASPTRIMRQLLTESVLLSVIAAAIGLVIAVKGTEALVALVPSGISTVQSLADVSVEWRVLAFTGLVAIGTGLLFGVAPARQAVKGDVQETLKEGGRGGSGASRSSARLRSALVVAEMSLALVLLTSAGLMVRSFAALEQVDLGFRPEGVLTARLTLPFRKYTNDTAVVRLFQAAESRVAAMPGVKAVGLISYLPLTGMRAVQGFNVEGRPTLDMSAAPGGDMRAVTPNYFAAMGIPLREGRGFTEMDRMGTPDVAVVSQSLARAFWPDSSAVGHYLLYEWDRPERVRIVGVAADVHDDGPDKEAYMEIYRPLTQFPYNSMALVVRGGGDPTRYAQPVRAAIREVDRDLPLATVEPMTSLVSRAMGTTRLSTVLFGLFGILGLVLAAIGIYGVMTYTVQQRRQEIGIRVALGASPRDVLRLVVWRGAMLSLAGIAIGLVGALIASGLMRNLLFGVPPHDAPTFLAIAVALACVGVLAAYVPGLKATRVDPVAVLRGE
ncbi:MAG TPA: ABC transporter permease [Gemmatimonadaceae bacterium]|jgi:putative ABC transport system permease protein